MNYIGSKKSLLPWLNELITDTGIDLSSSIFGDGFAGTGNVSSYFQQKYNTTIVATDTEYYSWIVTHVRLNVAYTEKIQSLIDELQSTKSTCGLVTLNYSPVCERMYFTEENARKIDGIRQHIELLKPKVTENEYYFLLASLMVASDKVSNVSCTYGAYLKQFKKSALRELKLDPIHTNNMLEAKHTIRHLSVLDNDWSMCDIVYLDPPYNSRQYGANYFLLNYILKYEDVSLHGKTGLCDYYKSPFCQKKKVYQAFKNMIEGIKSPLVLISYNDEGLLSKDMLKELLSQYGDVTLHTKTYKKFKAQQDVKKNNVQEYVWILSTKN